MELSEIKDLIGEAQRRSEIKDLIREAQRRKVTLLDLSYKNLTSLPPEISKLESLTRLYIDNNQLTFLPPEISKLRSLTELKVSHNQLTSLPPEISKLKNLTQLDVDNNQLTSLPPEISELKNLTQLYISYNQLTSLPFGISELRNLKELYIFHNQLTSLPSEISRLENLTRLDLSKNKLTLLPSEISGLKNLEKLDLSENKLTSLPPEILELDLEMEYRARYSGILLRGNPLETPPIEIVKYGREAVVNYFKSLEEEKKPLNEVKVLLVGDGGAGKTSLVKRLLDEGFNGNEHQTQGINIKGWKFKHRDKEIKVNFWDFGGQEIMHATHQFFLSKRSLYILVLDSRRDEKAEYWLKHIRSFGGDSPVLVILNKIDENPSFELNRKFLQEKYHPSIKGFCRISCKENRGIDSFSKKLKKEISEIEHLQIEWPKSWFKLKTKLEKMNCNFITYEKYQTMCLEENVNDKSSQHTLADFLNDLGVIVHFKDISLLDTHVLEPRWITEGVYKIINSETLAKKNGVLRFSLLDEILVQKKKGDYYYPPTRYDYIINLMKKFELCYAIDDETVLLPDLLAVPEPNFDFDSNESLKFFIEYDFLPRSIMPRFIVKIHRDIKDDLQWRTGVVLENKKFNSCAVVKSDNEAKKIYIDVNGGQKRDYFSSILFNLREINSSFEKLKVIEKIPLPDEPEIAVRYDHLVYLEEIGEEKYRPEGSKKEYKVRDLLGTVNKGSKQEELLEEILHILKNKNEDEKLEEIFQFFRKISDKSDNEETLSRKLNKVIMLKPSVAGCGVDFNEAINLFFKRRRQNY
jgi:small GTP-binding protein